MTARKSGGGHERLVLNTGWNLLGLGTPALVAFAAIPILIHGLGTERFGVLALAWGLIGYFSIFDLGLGTAVSQAIARRRGSPESAAGTAKLRRYVWTGAAAAALLGAVAGAGLAYAAPRLVHGVLSVPEGLQAEAVVAIRLLALSLPLVTSTAVLRGVLEAHHWFGAVNAIRLPMGIVTFAGPIAVLPFTTDLGWVVAVLVGNRVLTWSAHLAVCLHRLPALRRPAFHSRTAGALLRYGGWMTVAAVASAMMSYLDRFLIAALLPLAAVAYYVTPYDAMQRVAMLPGALSAALFPAFAERFRRPDEATAALFDWSNRVMLLCMFPAMLVVVGFAPEALRLWVGSEFAAAGVPVLQWISIGVFVYATAMMLAAAVQASGRPDVTGRLNLVELPFYLVCLFFFVRTWGIAGAALAWTLRLTIDAFALLWLNARLAPVTAAPAGRAAFRLALLTGALAVATVPVDFGTRAAMVALGVPAFAVYGWRALLTAPERAGMLRWLRGLGPALPGRAA